MNCVENKTKINQENNQENKMKIYRVNKCIE
jgi:hypothetical protein